MKKISVLLFLLVSLISFSQEIDNSFHFNLKSDRSVFQINSEESGETNLFLSDRKNITSFLLNENLDVTDSLLSKKPAQKKYLDVVGNSGNLLKTSVYWSNIDYSDIYIQTFDYEERIVKDTVFENLFSVDEENFLQVFSENEKFYILTIDKENLLHLYEFFDHQYKIYGIDMSQFEFKDYSNAPSKLYPLFPRVTGTHKTHLNNHVLCKIKNNTEVSLSKSSYRRKLFSSKNEILITIDNNNSCTSIIRINLDTKFTTMFEVEKQKINENSAVETDSNSFIVNDKIFQIVCSEKEVNLSCKELNGTLIKEYSINENDDFKINNTPFVKESVYGIERELEKTSQFLRKFIRYNIGISVVNTNSEYIVTLGSISDEKFKAKPLFNKNYNTVNLISSIAGPLVSLPDMSPYFYSYLEYIQRKSIYTTCVFDDHMEHLSNKIEDSAFEKIDKFEKEYNVDETFEIKTIFKVKEEFIFGFYIPRKGLYCFKKFK